MMMSVGVKSIFHQASFGRVGAGNTKYFALGTFQIIFHRPKNIFLKRVGITMNQDPECSSF